jgi:excisionase family DNA binding protein
VSANAMNAEPWVTAIDVARHLGVVKDTVYRWRERKGLPAHKIGRLWKFQLSEVDEWVRARGADEDFVQDSPDASRQRSGG